jgi:integrase
MQIYKREGSPYLWVTWYDQNGKRHRQSSGTVDKKEAEALASKWVNETFMQKHFGVKPEVPFSKALLQYAKANKRDYPQHFKDKTRYRLKFLSDWFGDYYLSQIKLTVIQEFMDERLGDVSLATAQRDLATLKAILNKAHQEELIDVVPRFPKMKAIQPRKRWISEDEEERLVRSASLHIVPLIRFAVDTGGRLSELLNLDWRNVDFEYKRVTFVKTKNGEDRTIRLSNKACSVLESLVPKASGPVFTYKGKPIKRVKTAFNTARKKAGMEDVRFHDLRHTFASRLVQGGIPLYDVMHLTGHKSLAMVQRYSHLKDDFQEAAIQVLNERGHNMDTRGSSYFSEEPAKPLKGMVPPG